MISDTKKRIISGVVLIFLLIAVVLSRLPSLMASVALVVGLIVSDELLINFLKLERPSWKYISAILISFCSLFLLFFHSARDFLIIWNGLALFISLTFLIYLFFYPIQSNSIIDRVKKFPPLSLILVIVPMISLSTLLKRADYISLLLILFTVTYMMDTGAWMVGKKWGRRKLWPAVSPKKSVEGLVGGMIISSITSLILLKLLLPLYFSYWHLLSFACLAVISQLGDLFQSKLKRQVGIKDSSSLIPGHGGFYDRLDSLFLVLPFFTFLISKI